MNYEPITHSPDYSPYTQLPRITASAWRHEGSILKFKYSHSIVIHDHEATARSSCYVIVVSYQPKQQGYKAHMIQTGQDFKIKVGRGIWTELYIPRHFTSTQVIDALDHATAQVAKALAIQYDVENAEGRHHETEVLPVQGRHPEPVEGPPISDNLPNQ